MRKRLRSTRSDNQGNRHRPWGGPYLLFGYLAILAACAPTKELTCPQVEPRIEIRGNPPTPEGYGEVLTLIEQGENDEAGSRLEALFALPGAPDAGSPSVFDLAARILTKETDLERLRAVREAFERYGRQLPEETDRIHAARIVSILDARIAVAERQRWRWKVVNELVIEKEKALQDLQYKLQKLEEIQKETEIKREDFQHK